MTQLATKVLFSRLLTTIIPRSACGQDVKAKELTAGTSGWLKRMSSSACLRASFCARHQTLPPGCSLQAVYAAPPTLGSLNLPAPCSLILLFEPSRLLGDTLSNQQPSYVATSFAAVALIKGQAARGGYSVLNFGAGHVGGSLA